MLCHTCQRKAHCLPATLATQDPQLHSMLTRLQRCNLQVAPVTSPMTQFTLRLRRSWGRKLWRLLGV